VPPDEPPPKRRARSQWRRGWHHVNEFLPTRVIRHLRADNGPVLAGGVALFVLLGILPLITAVVSVYAIGADPAAIPAHLRGLDEVLPRAVYEFITDQLQRAASRSSDELGFALAGSVFLALWATRSAANAMLLAINHVDGAPRRWLGWRWLVITIAVALGALVLAFTVLALIVALPTFGHALRPSHRQYLQDLGMPLTVVIAVGGLSMLYWLGTPHARAVRHVVPGALVATSLGVAASIGLSYYVTRISYANLYGAFGSAVVVLLWFYVCALAVLTGAVVNFELRAGPAAMTPPGGGGRVPP
jgi:membrane protein